MRARIGLFCSEAAAQQVSSSLEEILTELASSFGHSLTIRTDVIGALSKQLHGTELTEEAIDLAADCNAVLCLSQEDENVQSLAIELGSAAGVRVFEYPEQLTNLSVLRSQQLPSGRLCYPLQSDVQTLSQAFAASSELAARNGNSLQLVPFGGSLQETWQQAFAAAMDLPSPTNATLQELLALCVRAPGNLGTVLALPAACDSISAVCDAVSSLPSLRYAKFVTETPVLYQASIGSLGEDQGNPFGALLACADMFKEALGLGREAECLRISTLNVLQAGWRTADIASDGEPRIGATAACKLVVEQIALAGKLMNT